MSLKTLFASDMSAVFLNTDEFAESVTVGDGSTEWTVKAIVDRDPPESVGGAATKPSLRITFRNHATLGISATAFNAGKFYVRLGTDLSATAKKIFLHGKPVIQDEAMIVFEV